MTLVDDYRHFGDTVFADTGEDFGVRTVRQRLFQKDVDNALVRDIDEVVLEAVLVNEYIDDYALTDDDNQPLSNWWWHLGKIRAKIFPADQLPDYLQPVYSELK